MFTGIVEERGRVRSIDPGPGGARLVLECRVAHQDARIGSSVAVNGVCLTVVEHEDAVLGFDVVDETLTRTTLGSLASGDLVNLERPLALGDRLGGHLVQGHVDGVGLVERVESNGEEVKLAVSVPAELRRHLAPRGSIAVDGVSLTVASAENGRFTAALVPQTLAETTLGKLQAGDGVNVEVDVISKYVEQLLRGDE
ncbi:MAG: riboflavin synthase [Actinomycetota bacterium]